MVKRGYTGAIGRQIYKKAKQSGPLMTAAQQVASAALTSYLAGGSATQTTTMRRKTGSTRGLVHRNKKKMKMKKRTAIGSAKKSKKTRKFTAKVLNALKDTKTYGEYVYLAGAQLRQVNTDRYGMKYSDYNGRLICIGDLKANIDAYSVCFLNKLLGNDYRNAIGNAGSTSTFNTVFENLYMYFKSTSSHVVNIEVVECIAKSNYQSSETPEAMVAASMNDYTSRWAASNISAEQVITPSSMGTGIRHYTSLFQYYNVKTHKVKVLPGATSSLSFKRRGRTFDMSKYMDQNDNLTHITKGASYFFFRILNDPTVSGNPPPGSESTVHHWPSNTQGGVALHYNRTIRVIPSTIGRAGQAFEFDKPGIAIGNWVSFPEGELDQQVVYQNPIAVSTSGN